MSESRRIAIQAIHGWLKRHAFLDELLGATFSKISLSQDEKRYIYEISLGAVRHWRLLLYYMTDILQIQPPKDTLKLAILGASLYQRLFHEVEKAPYALVYEYVKIGKNFFPKDTKFTGFLNAILRKSLSLSFDPASIGESSSLALYQRLAVRFSMTDAFVHKLISTFGPDATYQILQAFEKKPPLYKRGGYNPGTGTFEMDLIESCRDFFSSKELENEDRGAWYLQNNTPPELMEYALSFVLEKMSKKTPVRLLDLCAAPGGKAIMCWQALLSLGFQFERIVLNEPNSQRMQKLEENIQRFQMPASFSTHDGRFFPIKQEERFNLIIVDAPCSNSGVLFKCPEARYRITEESISEQAALQYALLERALMLIHPPGFILYMTCSILPDENHLLVQLFLKYHQRVQEVAWKEILPDTLGHEGGFLSLMCVI